MKDARGGFTRIDNRVVTEVAPRIGAIPLAVYVVLCKFADYNTRACYPSLQTIGELLRISRPTVKKSIRTLQQAGLIAVRRRRTVRGDTSNEYTVLGPGTEANSLPGGGKDVAGGRQAGFHEQEPLNKNQVNTTARVAAQPSGAGPAPRPRDPNLDHPAVQAYRRVCELTPNKAQRAEIAATVTDVERWEQIMKQWQLTGYRKNNVAGMLDWYRLGIPERSQVHGSGVGGGIGSSGRKSRERYECRPRETPEEQARLDAEWESVRRQSRGVAGGDAPGEV